MTAAVETSSNTPSPTLALDAPDSIVIGSRAYRAANNGELVTLIVTFPAGAPRLSYAVVRVNSQRLNAAMTGLRDGEDAAHGWAVGVYVP